jgi:hypothetical protein
VREKWGWFSGAEASLSRANGVDLLVLVFVPDRRVWATKWKEVLAEHWRGSRAATSNGRAS